MKLLRSHGSTSELLQPPRLQVGIPSGFRRRSLSQDETWSRSKALSRSLSGSCGASPASSRGSEQDFFGSSRPLLTSRGDALDLISSQPQSALPPCVLQQIAQSKVEPSKLRSRLEGALQYFHFFRDLRPKVFAELISHASIEDFPVGRVLFLQGDLAGACYLMLSGNVGLSMEYEGLSLHSNQRSGSKPRVNRRRSKSMFITEPPIGLREETVQLQTAEGCTHSVEEMSVGDFADTLSPGKLFGEVGFYEQKERRPVSAKCLEDTTCVVIRKQAFLRAMKEEQKLALEERLAFLEEHLPGMREALATGERASPKGKSAISFKQAVFHRGHVFLRQNEPAEDVTYIVVNGAVEFLRCELMAPPRSILNDAATPGAARHAWGEEPKPVGSDVKRREITRRIGALARGGVFGSLLGETEPFTVRAETAQVEVLYIGGEAKQRMPRVVVDMLKEYIVRSTMFRLSNLRVNRATDRKRSQIRVAPSFPSLKSLFGTGCKDKSLLAKVSHALPDEKQNQTSESRSCQSSAAGWQGHREAHDAVHCLGILRHL